MRLRPTVLALVLAFGMAPALADSDRNEGKGRQEKRDKEWEKEQKKRAKEEEKRAKEREKRLEKERKREEKRAARDSYFARNGYERLSIPKGHYPPPGMCRAWYPDRPPGHQPPPQRCDAGVPRGAWLIEHPREHRGRVRVTAYEWQGYAPPPPPPPTVIYREAPPRPVFVPPPVLAVGEFEIANGVLVRVIVH